MDHIFSGENAMVIFVVFASIFSYLAGLYKISWKKSSFRILTKTMSDRRNIGHDILKDKDIIQFQECVYIYRATPILKCFRFWHVFWSQ